MSNEPSLSDLLPMRTVRVLTKSNINTIAEIKARYPEKLLRLDGFGMFSLRAVEAAFFPGETYTPQSRSYTRGRHRAALSEELVQFLRDMNPHSSAVTDKQKQIDDALEK